MFLAHLTGGSSLCNLFNQTVNAAIKIRVAESKQRKVFPPAFSKESNKKMLKQYWLPEVSFILILQLASIA